MAIGMTYEQYWYDDPLLVRAFYKANKLKKKLEDENAWLHGLYTLRALEVSLGNMFREKGSSPLNYPERPFSYKNGEESEEAKEKREDQEATWALAYMNNMVRAGKNWGKNKT